jgi:diguanylate cyclase (GGDEF)-like protein
MWLDDGRGRDGRAAAETRRAGGSPPRGAWWWEARTGLCLEVVRVASALFSVVSLAFVADLPDSVRAPAVTAHLALLATSLCVLLALPAVTRAGFDHLLGAGLTLGTIGFYVVTTALWHDVPGAGTALAVLALVEAPVRYGWRGAALSGLPVLWTSLLLRQVDATGSALSDGVVVSLVVVLLAAVLGVREVLRQSTQAMVGATRGFAEALLHLPLGVAVLDEHGRVVQANPALSQLLGPVHPELRLADRLRSGTGDAARLEQVLSGVEPDAHLICQAPDGRELSVGAAVVRAPGPRRTVARVRDVTEERRERASLVHASRHDALTGLLTRHAGTSALDEALSDAGAVAVLFLDLDGFKQLNDTAGHAVGDLVLKQAAARLAGALRPTERAVRWGGDEFVVVCSGVGDAAQLETVADRLLAVLREPFRVPGRPLVTLTASVGAARAHSPVEATALLEAADAAMYAAKRAGGDRWALAPAVPAPPVPVPVPEQQVPEQQVAGVPDVVSG